jgi:hypothetical protein
MPRGVRGSYTIQPAFDHLLQQVYFVKGPKGRDLCRCREIRDARKIARALEAYRSRPPKNC